MKKKITKQLFSNLGNGIYFGEKRRVRRHIGDTWWVVLFQKVASKSCSEEITYKYKMDGMVLSEEIRSVKK